MINNTTPPKKIPGDLGFFIPQQTDPDYGNRPRVIIHVFFTLKKNYLTVLLCSNGDVGSYIDFINKISVQ